MKIGINVLVLLAAATTAVAQTQPLQTEEATTAAGGRIVLEVGGDFIADEPNFQTTRPRDRWDGPRLRLVYSPADSVEIDLEWVAFIVAADDPDLGRVSDHGDVTLRTKVRFRDGGDGGVTIGARYTLTLPQTSFGEGLGPNTTRMAAQMLATLPVRRLRLHANAGLAIQDEVFRPHEQSDFLAYGAAAEWRFGERLAALAEIAGLRGTGKPGTDEHGELRVGLRFGGGRWGADVAIRRGLGGADGTWGATGGIAWVLRPGLR